MIRKFLIITALVVATMTGAVAAQDVNNSSAVDVDLSETEECNLYITEYISLCSADYVDGEAVLVLEGDRRERVTVTEAVALNQHREINRESFVVDGRTEIRLGVESSNGAAGVTIDDGDVLYGVPIKTSESLFAGSWGPSEAQAAGLGGALSVALVTLFLVLRAARSGSNEGERIA